MNIRILRATRGAVLEAEQVPRCLLTGGRRRGTAEAELEPGVLDDPHADPRQVPDRVEGDQRVVRAGLDAQVPAGVVGVEVLVGQCHHVQRAEREPVLGGGRDAGLVGWRPK
jgi:hypothetical protein